MQGLLPEHLRPIPRYDANAGPLCWAHPRREDFWFSEMRTPEQKADGRKAATICRSCPVLEMCREYSETARPTAGIWAGRLWRSGNGEVGQPSKRDLLAGS